MRNNNSAWGGDHAVAVLIVSPQGIPLIRDPKKPAPVYWKVPGGRGIPNETPQGTAVREIKEELGIALSEKDLQFFHEEDRGSHALFFFVAKLKSLPRLKQSGDEGEEIKKFTPEQVLALRDFFPNHLRVYQKEFQKIIAGVV